MQKYADQCRPQSFRRGTASNRPKHPAGRNEMNINELYLAHSCTWALRKIPYVPFPSISIHFPHDWTLKPSITSNIHHHAMPCALRLKKICCFDAPFKELGSTLAFAVLETHSELQRFWDATVVVRAEHMQYAVCMSLGKLRKKSI